MQVAGREAVIRNTVRNYLYYTMRICVLLLRIISGIQSTTLLVLELCTDVLFNIIILSRYISWLYCCVVLLVQLSTQATWE